MEREPQTIEDALNIAIKLEAHEKVVSSNNYEPMDGEGRGKTKPRHAYAINTETRDPRIEELSEKVEGLEFMVEQLVNLWEIGRQ